MVYNYIMKTYVRTIDDGTYYIDDNMPNNSLDSGDSVIYVRDGQYQYLISKSKIAKVSNRIEDIADCYVYQKRIYKSLTKAKTASKNDSNGIVYAAIWWKSGLAYIAELKNGRLELL